MRITPSSETGPWGRYFGWGFIWDGHIKRYLAVSLLQWFLSGQPNESSAGDPKGGSGLSSSRPGFWNFQELQWDGNILFVVRSLLITCGCVAVFSPVMGFSVWMLISSTAHCRHGYFSGEMFFRWPNIEIIELSSGEKYVITFFPLNSLSHWIWELDKIKFLGYINLGSRQILCCSTLSGQRLYLLR